MNEIQFLKAQLNTEQRHLEAVLQACTQAIASSSTTPEVDAFLRACVDYLLPSVEAQTARYRARLGLNYARSASADQPKSADALKLETLLEAVSAHWAAVEAASADLLPALHRATQALGQLIRAFAAASAVLESSAYSVEQWRKSAFVDARSILEERTRYARVAAALPLGIQLLERNGH
jgi:hypothetical protein